MAGRGVLRSSTAAFMGVELAEMPAGEKRGSYRFAGASPSGIASATAWRSASTSRRSASAGTSCGRGWSPATSSASIRRGSWITSIRRPCRRCRRSRRGRRRRRWPASPAASASATSCSATASAIRRCWRRWRSRSTTPAAAVSSLGIGSGSYAPEFAEFGLRVPAAARTRRAPRRGARGPRPPVRRGARVIRRRVLPAARGAEPAAAAAAPASADPRRRCRRAADVAAGGALRRRLELSHLRGRRPGTEDRRPAPALPAHRPRPGDPAGDRGGRPGVGRTARPGRRGARAWPSAASPVPAGDLPPPATAAPRTTSSPACASAPASA